MKNQKSIFECAECGAESSKWFGRCTVCGAWNSAVEVEKEGVTSEEYTKQVIVPEISKGAIVEALVRKEYSVSDELAILRQRNTKKAEFNAYNDRVEAIKAEADEILAGLAENE